MTAGTQHPLILEMQGICKAFPGVIALDQVDLAVRRAEVHAIVGENGAGKSTLMKILAGVYRPDAGHILLHGTPAEIHAPADALERGVAVIYQEFPLVGPLSVLANVYLGREPVKRLQALDTSQARARYAALCQGVGIYVDPDIQARYLTRGQSQLVEILKALDRDAKIIVMDEPTAALDKGAKDALFTIVRKLRDQGTTFIFVTHFIGEVFELADRITVLRDGRRVTTLETAATTPGEVVSLMIGHALRDVYPVASEVGAGAPLLEVRNLSVADRLYDISFDLHRGEIVGLAGLVGSGRTELAWAVYGLVPMATGEIRIAGQRVRLGAPHKAIARGLGLLPEDRKRTGLVLEFPVYKNLSLSALKKFSPHFVIRFGQERRAAQDFVRQLRISTPSVDQRVRFLSGGNQQKVVLGRILATDPDILLLDEPTQGIDIGAKEEIFQLMRRLADQGKALLFISSELKEIAGVCDRALVLKGGRLVGEFARGAMSEATLMQAAILGTDHAPSGGATHER